MQFVRAQERRDFSLNHLGELIEERFGVPYKTARKFLSLPKRAHDAVEVSAKDPREAKLKRSSQYLKKRRQPRDPEVDEALYRSYKKRREEQKRVNWKWLKLEYKKIFQEVHGATLERVSGSVISGFLKRHNIVMLKKTNKKSLSIEERLPDVQNYHRHILSLRNSVRADRPNQPRDPDGGRFSWSDTYSFDEHPVELIRNCDQTYEEKGTERVQIKQPKGSLDQRQCSGLLTFRAVGPQNVKPILIFPSNRTNKKKARQLSA